MDRKRKSSPQRERHFPPAGFKSYYRIWLEKFNLNSNRMETNHRNGNDGWRQIALYILIEAVFTAGQEEDPVLAEEAKLWLSSHSARIILEACNINYNNVQRWIQLGCPIPNPSTFTLPDNQVGEQNLGFFSGHLSITNYDPILPEDIAVILSQVYFDISTDKE